MSEKLDVLKEMRDWLKFMGMQEAEDVLRELLDTNEKRLVYTYADGSNSLSDIENLTGIANSTAGDWLSEWSKQGVVAKTGGSKSPYKHLVSLDTLGIEYQEDGEDE